MAELGDRLSGPRARGERSNLTCMSTSLRTRCLALALGALAATSCSSETDGSSESSSQEAGGTDAPWEEVLRHADYVQPTGEFDHPPGAHPPIPETKRLGLMVRFPGEERFKLVPWGSVETIQDLLDEMRDNTESAEILFLPGRYEIDGRIFVHMIQDLTISGTPGVELYFREGPDKVTSVTENVDRGSLEMMVADPSKMEAGRRYQIYKESGIHDRILEFTVDEVVDGVVRMELPALYMPHVKEVPPGSWIMEEHTFFRVSRSPRFTLQGITMDGMNRGGIRGHTIYCGVHANGLYKVGFKATTMGLTVRNCTFRNLKGRGIVWYGLGGAVIEHNRLENITAQAIEIDHLSAGIVRNNIVNGAEAGVMLNDAYDSIVEANVLLGCKHGIRFLALYDNGWANHANIVRDNIIGPGSLAGVMFSSEGMVDNVITGNTFLGLRREHWVKNGDGNLIEGNQ